MGRAVKIIETKALARAKAGDRAACPGHRLAYCPLAVGRGFVRACSRCWLLAGNYQLQVVAQFNAACPGARGRDLTQ
eukprot:9675450-Alexandrium_andersonii.AAC.1